MLCNVFRQRIIRVGSTQQSLNAKQIEQHIVKARIIIIDSIAIQFSTTNKHMEQMPYTIWKGFLNNEFGVKAT